MEIGCLGVRVLALIIYISYESVSRVWGFIIIKVIIKCLITRLIM